MQDAQTWPLIAVNIGLGVTCAACLAAVAWASAHDVAVRWRTRGRMPDTWPPGPPDREEASASHDATPRCAGDGGARC